MVGMNLLPPVHRHRHHHAMYVNFSSLQRYLFVSFQQITVKVDNFTTDFKVFFPAVLTDFPNWSQSKVEKTVPFMEGSICKFSFPIIRKNCQIESDVCVCCKRDSKPLHWLSTHEQKKKAKKKLTLHELGFSKSKQEQSLIDFFVHHFIKQTDIFFCFFRKLFVRGCTFLVTTTYV